MPKEDKFVIWPAYLDSSLSRNNGRKIPKNKAVTKPSIEEIITVTKKLGLNPIIEEKKYPKLWYEQTRRVIILKKGSKRKILSLISDEIIKMRQKSK
ncbi:MAG: signal recognition particle protein Srp19 [Caldisphaera sp.]|jgi:signal recognition particle subunit SRP19|uniref:signal recognition particle protein Srp19 n=1 Tax=Caldisphaera sp. TaxID=2060322 RepID=UPI000CB6A291|nr:signal recognition particle protein Srp19 [Caldisphaera sp.]PMP90060.1 MAG: signal recognition particle protein Srp19 [Caldisphaera sp.]